MLVKPEFRWYLTPMPIRWKLAKVMDAKGMTPYRLAKLTGLSAPSCYDLYNAKLPPVVKTATLEKLCVALGCDVSDLLDHRKR